MYLYGFVIFVKDQSFILNMNLLKQFKKDAKRVASDLKHRKTIRFNMDKYDAAVVNGNKNYQDKQLAREQAAWIKRNVLENWSEYLLQFETNFTANGGVVHWARNDEEAIKKISTVLEKHAPSYIMKTKSMVTEEIGLNEALESLNIKPIETDLGEYIVQVAGEKPYHILTPAMHKSRDDVAHLFHEKFKTSEDATPEEITKFVRDTLRDKFCDLKVGITGANFLIADTGSVALTENEGNGVMTTAFPDVHIIIAGIERIIPSIKQLSLFWPLLANAGTGQKVTVYNSIFTGSKRSNETDGPKELHIILLDNGRTNLYAKAQQYEALSCIRCGACLNACPIYKNIGGYTYGAVYSGPIGSVITPHMKPTLGYDHLSFASTLCGKCKDVCPVKIDLPLHLLQNRKEVIAKMNATTVTKQGMILAKRWLSTRKNMDAVPSKLLNIGTYLFSEKIWGSKRNLPHVSNESFSKQYKKKHTAL